MLSESHLIRVALNLGIWAAGALVRIRGAFLHQYDQSLWNSCGIVIRNLEASAELCTLQCAEQSRYCFHCWLNSVKQALL